MTKYIIVIVWIVIGIFNAGFINADLRNQSRELYQNSYYSYRGQSFALGWGIVSGPIGFIIIPFVTGFYSSGWTLTRRPFPCKSPAPELWCSEK